MVQFLKMEPRRSAPYAVLAVVLLFVASVMQAADVKPVYQETDKKAPNYLTNRRALVGPGCVVNSLFDGVKVLGGVTGLDNLVNDDLTDYAVMPSLADVGAGVEPLVSVKDLDHAYAAGTEAGFSLQASSDSKLLSLDISKFYLMWFYRNGEKVGEATVSQGQDIKGLDLSLIQIPGNSDFSKDIVATAPAEFDEVKLVRAGVDVSAISSLNIRYAFVGKAREYTLTNSAEGGISDYAEATGRGTITVEGHGLPGDALSKLGPAELVDDKLDNGYTVRAVLGVISSLPATVVTKAADGEETFKAGTEIGFAYHCATGINLSVASSVTLTLYDRDNKRLGEYPVSTSVLGVSLLSSKECGFVIKAPVDFSSAKILFPELLGVEVGATTVRYAFVRLAPSLASHHCPIDVMADRSVCDCNDVYYLNWNKQVPVKWTVDKQPEGADATIDANGKATLHVPGQYRFKATAEDGCSEYTTLGYGDIIAYAPEDNGEKIIENYDDGTGRYALSDRQGGGLIDISSGVKNRRALLTPSLRDFAYLKASVDVADDKAVVGVKTKDGSNMADGYTGAVKAGFVVSAKGTALSADVLNMFNIRIYKDGKQVESNLTKHWNAVSAGLIGNGQEQKMRFCIDIPAGTDFDELVLWKTGVLSASLSQLNVYYAFVDDDDKTIPSEDGLYQAEIISHDNTNASVDYAATDVFSVANIGNGVGNIANVIDGDTNTGVDFPLGANLGGAKLAVNLGLTAGKGQQLVVVMSKVKIGLGVELGNALKVETWLDGTKQEELTSWHVLGADIIGDGGQTYAVLNPTKDFDQVRIVPLNVLGALTNIKLYAIALRNDANDDGIPDVVDMEPCMRELVLDEDETLGETSDVQNARLVLHRTLNNDAAGAYTWNSIVLPVALTRAQLVQGFGNGVKLAELSRVEDGWIYFKELALPSGDADVAMEADKPYLIMPSRDADVTGDAMYSTMTGLEIGAPVYFITDVNYSKPKAMTVSVKGTDDTNVTFTGSYTRPTIVGAGAYMLRSGEMVHTAVDHKIKAYRAWITTDELTVEAGAQELRLRVADLGGTITGIASVTELPQAAGRAVYNLSGQRVAAQEGILPKGVYVVNGKKRIIK